MARLFSLLSMAMVQNVRGWSNLTIFQKPCGAAWTKSDGSVAINIVPSGTNKCLVLSGDIPKDGALLEVRDCDGMDNQKWIFHLSTQSIQYSAVPSLCIDNLGGSGKLGLSTCSSNATQKWNRDEEKNTIQLVSETEGSLCMHLMADSNDDGIQVHGCNGKPKQQWSVKTACTPDGRCQRGTCCSGQTHGTLHCGVSFCEGMCEKAVGWISGKLATQGCAEIVGEGDVICEAAGLGPEDPLSDICAAIVTTGCPIIAKYIAKKVTDPKAICTHLGSCGLTGSRCGCLRDGACADSTGDCCSLQKHHTGACPSNIRCGCLPDGECAGSDGAHGCCSGTSHHTARCGSNIRCGRSAGIVV